MQDGLFEIVSADEILAFRQAMLWPGKPISYVMVPGDADALHLCRRSKNRIIGAGSFFFSGTAVQLRKLAVHPEFRGRRIGSALVQRGAEIAVERGARLLWCDARVGATDFYRRLGFAIDPNVFFKSSERYQKAQMPLPIA